MKEVFGELTLLMLMFPLLSCSLYSRTLETVEKATQPPHGDTALQQI